MEHSPTPWRLEYEGEHPYFVDAIGKKVFSVAYIGTGLNEANDKFILESVNKNEA